MEIRSKTLGSACELWVQVVLLTTGCFVVEQLRLDRTEAPSCPAVWAQTQWQQKQVVEYSEHRRH